METMNDLQVERAAHDDTAEKLVELQQRLEVTLQELSNLERYVKRNEQVPNPGAHPPAVERLLKEESYLKSRLVFVQHELSAARVQADTQEPGRSGSLPVGGARTPAAVGQRTVSMPRAAAVGAGVVAAESTAEERVLDSALSI